MISGLFLMEGKCSFFVVVVFCLFVRTQINMRKIETRSRSFERDEREEN